MRLRASVALYIVPPCKVGGYSFWWPPAMSPSYLPAILGSIYEQIIEAHRRRRLRPSEHLFALVRRNGPHRRLPVTALAPRDGSTPAMLTLPYSAIWRHRHITDFGRDQVTAAATGPVLMGRWRFVGRTPFQKLVLAGRNKSASYSSRIVICHELYLGGSREQGLVSGGEVCREIVQHIAQLA